MEVSFSKGAEIGIEVAVITKRVPSSSSLSVQFRRIKDPQVNKNPVPVMKAPRPRHSFE